MLNAHFAQNQIEVLFTGSPTIKTVAKIQTPNNVGGWVDTNYPALSGLVAGGAARYDLRDILKDYDFGIALPSISENEIKNIGDKTFRCRLLAESVGIVNVWSKPSSEIRVIAGGISEEKFEDFAGAFFTDYMPTNGKFMSFAPLKKRIDLQQPDWLYWLQNISASAVNVTVIYHFYFANIRTTDLSTTVNLTGIKPYEVLQIPVGYDAATRDIELPTLPEYYTIQVVTPTYASEIRTYYPDAIPTESPVYLVYRNNFDVFESIRCHGSVVRSSNFSFDESETGGKVAKYAVENIKTSKVNTGALEYEWLEYIESLLFSRDVFEIKDNKYRSVVVSNTSYDTFDTTKLIDEMTIEYKSATKNTKF